MEEKAKDENKHKWDAKQEEREKRIRYKRQRLSVNSWDYCVD